MQQRRKRKGIYLLAGMCCHDLEQRDGADEVVVVVKQRLGHALPDGLEPGEVDHRLEPAN